MSTTDNTPPQLLSIDLTYDPIRVGFSLAAECNDDLSGVKYVAAFIRRPDGEGYGFGLYYNAETDRFEGFHILSEYTPPGEWTLYRVEITDKVDNRTNVSDFSGVEVSGSLTVPEKEITDNTPPELLSIDLTYDPIRVGFSLAAECNDDLSGVKYVAAFIRRPDGEEYGFGLYYNAETDRFEGFHKLSEYTPPGEWTLYRVEITDRVDNRTNVSDFSGVEVSGSLTVPQIAPTLQSTTATSNQLILTFSEDIQIAGGGTINPAYITVTVDGQARKVTKSQILPPDQPSIHTASQLALTLPGRSLDSASSLSIAYNPPSNGSNAGFITDLDGNALASISTQVVDTLTATRNMSKSGLSAAYKNLILAGTNVTGYGNTQDNTITGNDTNNTLDGLAGADAMIGKGGNDTYFIDNVGDAVTEIANEGTDTVQSAITYALGDHVENLVLIGSTAINGTGNSTDNTITGNSAANILNGNGGRDSLIGSRGNDTYIIDSIDDAITETGSSSDVDSAQSSVSWVLGTNLENLTLTGSSTINGTGNNLNNTIIGNSGSNILDGGTGGTDRLTGLDGADIFKFSARPTVFRNTTADHITDFSSSQGDKIQITKSAFGITGSTATLSVVSGASAVTSSLGTAALFIYDTSSGELHWNQNGISKGAGSGGVLAILDNKATLSAGDLVLV
jgi:Ca2+-binding RTX toxin-like protein